MDVGQSLSEVMSARRVVLICELTYAGEVLLTWNLQSDALELWQPPGSWGNYVKVVERSVKGKRGRLTFKEATHHARVFVNQWVKETTK
jgi:hypothetical protein